MMHAGFLNLNTRAWGKPEMIWSVINQMQKMQQLDPIIINPKRPHGIVPLELLPEEGSEAMRILRTALDFVRAQGKTIGWYGGFVKTGWPINRILNSTSMKHQNAAFVEWTRLRALGFEFVVCDWAAGQSTSLLQILRFRINPLQFGMNRRRHFNQYRKLAEKELDLNLWAEAAITTPTGALVPRGERHPLHGVQHFCSLKYLETQQDRRTALWPSDKTLWVLVAQPDLDRYNMSDGDIRALDRRFNLVLRANAVESVMAALS